MPCGAQSAPHSTPALFHIHIYSMCICAWYTTPMKKILSLCALLMVILIAYKSYTPHVSAQGTPTVYTAGPVTGWLWSTNVGWISLSCFNAGQGCTSGQPLPANHYGVFQQADGSWIGHAWSDTLGWLQFGVTPPNCDTSLTSPSCISKVIGNQLYGYAHFVNATTNPTPGFDGWVSFNANNDHDLVNTGVPVPSSTSYGFTFSAPIGMTGTMSVQTGSLAWEGDSVVGWLAPVGIIAPAPCSGSTCTALTLAASPNPVGPNYEVALTIGAPTPTNFGGGAPTAVSWQVGSGSVQTIWKDTTGTTIPLSGITCPSSANATTNINVDAITASITAQTNVTFTVTCNDINGNPITAQTIVTVNPLTLNATSTANLDSCPVSGTAVTSVPVSWQSNISDPSTTAQYCTVPYKTGTTAPAYTQPASFSSNITSTGTWQVKCKDGIGSTTTQQITITDAHPKPATGVCANTPPVPLAVAYSSAAGTFCPVGSSNAQTGYTPLPQSVGYTVSYSKNVSCTLMTNNNAAHTFVNSNVPLSPSNSTSSVTGSVTIPSTASGWAVLTCIDSAANTTATDHYVVSILGSGDSHCTSGSGPLPACSDGIDNDGDGLIDAADPGCYTNGLYDPNKTSEVDPSTYITLNPPVADFCPVGIVATNAPLLPGTVTYTAHGFTTGASCKLIKGSTTVATHTLPSSLTDSFSVASAGTYSVKCTQGLSTASAQYGALMLLSSDSLCASNDAPPVCSNGIDDDNDQLIDSQDPGCYTNGLYDPNKTSEVDPSTYITLNPPVADFCPVGIVATNAPLLPGTVTYTAHGFTTGASCKLIKGSTTVATHTLPSSLTDSFSVASAGTYSVKCTQGLSTASAQYGALMLLSSDSLCASNDAPPVCSNGIDDDNDQLIDSQDPGCHTDGDASNISTYDPNGTSELNLNGTTTSGTTTSSNPPTYSLSLINPTDAICPAGSPNPAAPLAPTTVHVSTSGYSIVPGKTSCTLTNNTTGTVVATHDLGTNPDFSVSAPGAYTVSCTDSTTGHSDSTSYHLAQLGASDPQCMLPQCMDGIDNDGDGLIDAADPGCHTDGNASNSASYDPLGASEANPQIYACDDGIDNDGDGLVDAQDPGCYTYGVYVPTKNSEYNNPGICPPWGANCPEICDGIDNNANGQIDENNVCHQDVTKPRIKEK